MEIKNHDELMDFVQKNLDEKMENARQAAQQEADRDKEKIEMAISLITDRLLYKVVKPYGGKKRYVLATPEMFYEDYVKEPDNRWNRGLKFAGEDKAWYQGVFSVNGEAYHDMRYILNKYEKNLEETANKLSYQRERVREIQNQYDEMVSEWPEIKKVAAEWNSRAHEGECDGSEE